MPSIIHRFPIGNLCLEADDKRLIRLEFTTHPPATSLTSHAILRQTIHELEGYFKGERASFSIPIHRQGTVFEQEVYQALLAIPYGETRSYQDIAKAIGRPLAARAVGQACGKNRLLLLVPCHRVISANGTLGGFALSLDIKKDLLTLEKNHRLD